MSPASDQARFSQMLGRPETQKRHRPQCGSQLRMTWSPGVRPETPGPTSSTTPAPSWPRMTGRGASWIPSTTCRSEWQTPLAAIRTATSPGPGGSTSTFSTRSGSPISNRIAAPTGLPYLVDDSDIARPVAQGARDSPLRAGEQLDQLVAGHLEPVAPRRRELSAADAEPHLSGHPPAGDVPASVAAMYALAVGMRVVRLGDDAAARRGQRRQAAQDQPRFRVDLIVFPGPERGEEIAGLEGHQVA